MNTTAESNYLDILQDSITHRNVLLLHYRSPANGNRSEREIEPLGIYFTADKWMLVAFCRLRKAQREFRFDGLQSIEKIGDTFPPHQFTFS